MGSTTTGLRCFVLPPDSTEWQLSAEPTLRLGADEQESAQFLRIAGVARMPSGEIVVANGATRELREPTMSGMTFSSSRADPAI